MGKGHLDKVAVVTGAAGGIGQAEAIGARWRPRRHRRHQSGD